MTIKTLEEAKNLLLQFKNEIFQDKILEKKTFLSQCQTYFKIVFQFSLKKSMNKHDLFMIRQAIHAVWVYSSI